jgi:hypothetical protein
VGELSVSEVMMCGTKGCGMHAPWVEWMGWMLACFHNAAGKRRPLDDPCSDPDPSPARNELNPVEARWILF